MKKSPLVLMPVWLLVLLLCASVGYAQTGMAQPLKVVCSNTLLADMAREVGGDRVQVQSLIPINTDPHTYEATPSDAQRLTGAQLIITNGLHLEGWLDELIATAARRTPVCIATRGIEPIGDPAIPGAADPHCWLDPLMGIIYAENIYQSLLSVDPTGRDYYTHRLEAFRGAILELHREQDSLFAAIPVEKRWLLTSHDAFRYFARRYNFQVASVFGNTTEAEVQAQDLRHLITVIESTGVACVFSENILSPTMLAQVASDANIVVGGRLFTDSVGEEESGADTYIGMLRTNAQIIVNGLTRAGALAPTDKNLGGMLAMALAVFALGLGWVLWRLRASMPKGAVPPLSHIVATNLAAGYPDLPVLSGLNIELETGRVIGLAGPNGAGKSTLLKALLGTLPTQAGHVEWMPQPARPIAGRVAYLPQKDALDWQFPITVIDFVLTGRYGVGGLRFRSNREDRKAAWEALERLKIADLANRHIRELSGGQQQRVFLARALAQGADALFLDEPFVGIDATTERLIVEILHQEARQGRLVLVVHHDLATLGKYFNEVILLNRSWAVQGPPAEVLTPENLSTAYGIPNFTEPLVVSR